MAHRFASALLLAALLPLAAQNTAGCSGDDVAFEGGGGGETTGSGQGKCRSSKDASCAGGICIAEEDVSCYTLVLPETPCVNDPECMGTAEEPQICAYNEKTCENGGKSVCMKGCLGDDDCAATQACSFDHHCRPKTCGACPELFFCGGEGNCVRPVCQVDDDCEKGYCVNGLCHSQFGTCVP